MSERAAGWRMRPGVSMRSAGLARAVAFVTLLATTVPLTGCSLRLFGHRSELPVGGTKQADTGEPGDIQEARQRVMAFPDDPYWRYRLSQFYVVADSLPAAEVALQSALARDATYAPALALLSKLYFESGRHAEAVRLLEPVRSRPDAFPSDTRQALLTGLALHLDALGRPDLAGAAIPRAADADLKRTGPAMVYVSLRGDHPDSAADLARATLHEDSRSAVNLNNYGITRLRAADPKGAREAFMKAIERDPGLPGPYYNLAILEKYYLLDDDAASRWFRDYWKRSHQDPDSLVGVFADEAPKSVAQKGR
jgi:tetratricopeptide (TPR) repeat protein